MAKPISKLANFLSRLVNVTVGILLIPPVIGLLAGLRSQLAAVPVGDKSFFDWTVIGVAGYVTLHLLFYRPVALFRVQHGLLSRLAQWLFGGHVSTTGGKGARGAERSEKPRGKGKDDEGGAPASGSTLLVVSPYVFPLYPVLACALAWALKHWLDPSVVDAPAAVVIGATLALHWVMTADDLQGGRAAKSRVPLDTHLIALGMIGVISLLIVGAALPMAAPDVSWPAMLSEALARAGAIYSTVIQRLFL